ncbi:hypothetical protein Fcan01_23642 [Folsomia candida]|uniref:Uncharacterized protein n=1 Tax=Folsomia candida TaxID=158441 RepID=A0A226DA39_FOLCA|nr:hypothetical protein Fcan01_23642 [Folsomia candida]
MVDCFLSKDGGGGYEYFPIPPHVQTWDIFQRKWRPSLTLVPVKWTMFAVNDFDHACIPSLPYDEFWKAEYNTIYVNVQVLSYLSYLERIPRVCYPGFLGYWVCPQNPDYPDYPNYPQNPGKTPGTVKKFESTWTVWFTPYDYHCWTAVGITVSLLPIFWMIRLNFRKWLFYYLNEIYFLTSLAFRQPIRSYSYKYLGFVMAVIILSSGYESLITMKLILPTELFKIENIHEFFKLRGYSTIAYDGSRDGHGYDQVGVLGQPEIASNALLSHFVKFENPDYPDYPWVLLKFATPKPTKIRNTPILQKPGVAYPGYDVTLNDLDIRAEFIKYNLIDELPKVFKETLILLDQIKIHTWRNSSAGIFFSQQEGYKTQEIYRATIEARVQTSFEAEQGEDIKCGTFPIGGTIHAYSIISADYLREIDGFMERLLWGSGLRTGWRTESTHLSSRIRKPEVDISIRSKMRSNTTKQLATIVCHYLEKVVTRSKKLSCVHFKK